MLSEGCGFRASLDALRGVEAAHGAHQDFNKGPRPVAPSWEGESVLELVGQLAEVVLRYGEPVLAIQQEERITKLDGECI